MNYLILSQPSEAYAGAISRALWAISRPEQVRDDSDVSQLYTSWQVHPESGAVALFLPDESKPVHALGDIDTFCGLVGNPNVTIDGETLKTDAHLQTLRGGRVNPLNLIQSTAFAVALKTRDQLEAEGWFPTDEI